MNPPDKNDARSRLIVNLTGSIIGLAMVGLFWFLLVELFRIPVPTVNHDVLLVVIGALLREVGNISTYFFTGDVTARKQADTIATQARTLNAQTTPPVAGITTSDGPVTVDTQTTITPTGDRTT